MNNRQLRPADPSPGEEVAMVRCFKDSTGNKVVSTDPLDILLYGPRSIVQERLLDTRERMRDIGIINDAAHAKSTLQSIRDRERQVQAREDAVQAREDEIMSSLLGDAIDKINSLAARMDAIEAAANKDPDEDTLTEPPASSAAHSIPGPSPDDPLDLEQDDGDLQTPVPKSLSKLQSEQLDDGQPTDPYDPLSEPPMLPRPPIGAGFN
jgi:hypothetical protein